MKNKMIMVITTAALLTGFTVSAADKETRKEAKETRKEEKAEVRKEREAVREKADRRETKVDIDKRIQAINRLDNSPSVMRHGMAAVSKETAVPLPKIEAEHKEHPNVGLAGLFVAHELSTRTHKPVEHFLKAHATGKSWTAIAAANNENLDTLEAKLTRIEQAMRDAK